MNLRFGISHADFAGFPAVRAIILAVHAQADVVLALAVATIALATALGLGLVALRTQDCAFHTFATSGGYDAASRVASNSNIGQCAILEQAKVPSRTPVLPAASRKTPEPSNHFVASNAGSDRQAILGRARRRAACRKWLWSPELRRALARPSRTCFTSGVSRFLARRLRRTFALDQAK